MNAELRKALQFVTLRATVTGLLDAGRTAAAVDFTWPTGLLRAAADFCVECADVACAVVECAVVVCAEVACTVVERLRAAAVAIRNGGFDSRTGAGINRRSPSRASAVSK